MIEIHVTVTGCGDSSCWKGPLLFSTSPVWLHGSKVAKTPSGRRTFRAQDLGFEYGAPTGDYADEDNELYLNKHGSEAHELHRREETLLLVWRDEDDLKLRELMQAK